MLTKEIIGAPAPKTDLRVGIIERVAKVTENRTLKAGPEELTDMERVVVESCMDRGPWAGDTADASSIDKPK